MVIVVFEPRNECNALRCRPGTSSGTLQSGHKAISGSPVSPSWNDFGRHSFNLPSVKVHCLTLIVSMNRKQIDNIV